MPRVIALYGVLGIVVVGAVAVLLARPRALLSDDPILGRPPVLPGTGLPSAEELASVRFPVAVRGYRMADVDAYFAAASAALAAATQSSAELPELPELPAPELSGEVVPDSEQEPAQPVTEQAAPVVPAGEEIAVAAAAVAATEASQPEMPQTPTSSTATGETKAPAVQVPGTETPGTHLPTTEIPETEIPETETLETETLETQTPETQTPRTEPASEEPGAPDAAIEETASDETASEETASAEPAAVAGAATAGTAGSDGTTDAAHTPELPREQTSRSDVDAGVLSDAAGSAVPQVAATGDRQLPD